MSVENPPIDILLIAERRAAEAREMLRCHREGNYNGQSNMVALERAYDVQALAEADMWAARALMMELDAEERR